MKSDKDIQDWNRNASIYSKIIDRLTRSGIGEIETYNIYPGVSYWVIAIRM